MSTMNKKNIVIKFVLGFGFVSLAFGVNYLFAWTSPTGNPPVTNTSAPINVGTTNQVKDAGLSVDALSVFGNTYSQGWFSLGDSSSNPGGFMFNLYKNDYSGGTNNTLGHIWGGMAAGGSGGSITGWQAETIAKNSGGVAYGIVGTGFANTDGNVETVTGVLGQTLTSANDIGYNFYARNRANGGGESFTTGGTQYGLYINQQDTNVTNHGVWQVSQGTNYFTGDVGIGSTNITDTLTLGGTPGVDGIKFPDGTVQTTAAGGATTIASAIGSGGVIAPSAEANLGSTWSLIMIGAVFPTNGGDEKGSTQFLYKEGGTAKAALVSTTWEGEVTISATKACSSNGGSTPSNQDVCVRLSGGNIYVQAGSNTNVNYVIVK